MKEIWKIIEKLWRNIQIEILPLFPFLIPVPWIEEVVKIVQESSSFLEIEISGWGRKRIKISKNGVGQSSIVANQTSIPKSSNKPPRFERELLFIKSFMVGRIRFSVKEGDLVEVGSKVGEIEALKTRNDVFAATKIKEEKVEIGGIVERILVENEKSVPGEYGPRVEYGQSLILIKPA